MADKRDAKICGTVAPVEWLEYPPPEREIEPSSTRPRP